MLVQTEEQFWVALGHFTPVMAVDTETSGFDVWNVDELCGISVCTSDERTYYFPFRHKSTRFPLLAEAEGPLNLPIDLLRELLVKFEELEVYIGHNPKFDLAAMYKDGYEIEDHTRLEDTVTAARLMSKGRFDRLDLQTITARFFPEEDVDKWKTGFKEYLKSSKSKSYDEAHPAIMAEYAEHDALNTWRCRNKLVELIQASEQTIVWEQEVKLTKVLWEMEKTGLYFDRDYLIRKLPLLENKLADLYDQIIDEVGEEFDILSNKQLTGAMAKIGVTSASLTKAGNAKWDTSELLAVESPIGGKILEYRGVSKLISTYFEPLFKWQDDRQHPSFKSAGTITGRMSCSNPNLQNLANKSIEMEGNKFDDEALEALKALLGARGAGADRVHGDASKERESYKAGTFSNLISTTSQFEDNDNSISVKRLYVPPEDYLLYLIDFNQMEMRVFSDYVRDASMQEVLENKHFDFHAYVATQVWGVHPGHTLWKFYRTLAKAINFGLIYGIGVDKLAQQIQKSKEEALQYRFDYFSRFPKASDFMRRVQAKIELTGKVKNRFGRTYWIEKDRAYTGVNYLVQGTSADIVKNRMVACHDWIQAENLRSRLVVQVHDELIFYVHKDEETFAPKMFKEIIEERLIDTFLPTEVEKGKPSWAQKSAICVECLVWLTKEEKEGEVIHVCNREPAQVLDASLEVLNV
jgi:DNA polymerase I